MTYSNLNLNDYMQRDAAILLYGNAIAGITISLITSTFLVFAFTYPSVEPFKYVWWWMFFILLTIRLVNVLWWKTKLKDTEFDGKRHVTYFTLGANITAILWAVYLVYSITQGNKVELTTTIIAVASMAGGSASVLAAHKFTAMFYPFILLFPGSICLLLSGDNSLQLLGVLGISFSIVMLIITKKSADFTIHTLFLKNENTALIHSMEEQVKQRTEKIYQLSNLDPLTGLYNRDAFLKQLKSLIQKSNTPFALLFIDLDGFKKINDSIGHKAGDQILKRTADRLKNFTQTPSLICRWGGDEFLIVFEEDNEVNVIEQSKRLIAVLSEHHNTENNILSVGATIGIAFHPHHAVQEDRLIQLADMAMYYQKNQMRSTVGVFSEHMEKLYSYELHLKNSLSEAIEKQQFRLVFQPIISSNTLKVTAFEALIRWQLDDKNIPPDEFIYIAEQYGLIHEIGAWVIENACKEASKWDAELQLAVCVNVSVIQLQDDNFIDIIKKALANNQLPAKLLHIEITESVFVANITVISNQIKRLQAMGINVSIDDFGTGYSSLSAMQDLSVNTVKIDRSFINNMNHNGDAIISAVIHIASSLNFLVVAEGVETEEQVQALLKLGVHYLQGYYYAKPIEIESLGHYINQSFDAPRQY